MQTCVEVNLPDAELNALVSKAKDWVIMHGNGICFSKYDEHPGTHTYFQNNYLKLLSGASMRPKKNYNPDQVQITSFLLLPSAYPREQFRIAKEVQTLLNELMHSVAHDYEFLSSTLKRYTY